MFRLDDQRIDIDASAPTPVAMAAKKQPWPKDLPHQFRAVADARGRWRERLPTILHTLVAIGRARIDGNGRYTSA